MNGKFTLRYGTTRVGTIENNVIVGYDTYDENGNIYIKAKTIDFKDNIYTIRMEAGD
jgi:hypothetical protein